MTLPINETHRINLSQLDMPPRTLLGPGPSNAHPQVLQAGGTPLVGHLDPAFVSLMDEVKELLRYTFQTDNELTIPISGTGERIAEMAGRYSADVRLLEQEWGKVFSLKELRAGLEKHRPAILALVHGETSSGACQPLEGVGELCREYDCLLLVDTVASLGGVPFYTDAWQVDIVYSGAQKCLSRCNPIDELLGQPACIPSYRSNKPQLCLARGLAPGCRRRACPKMGQAPADGRTPLGWPGRIRSLLLYTRPCHSPSQPYDGSST